MLINTINSLFERDLDRIINELQLYKNEENIWLIEKNISNSAGNLALHIFGNLNNYIGKEIGRTNYVRDRELEFSQKNVPIQTLIDMLNETKNVIINSLLVLNEQDLQKEYPVRIFSEPSSIEYILIHLTSHLAYHLGQINYHRRLIDG